MIRLATASDVDGILAIYTPIITQTCISFEYEVPDTDSFWQRVNEVLSFAPWLVCELEGKIAGYAYAGKHRSRAAYQWSVELSVYVHPDFKRWGLGFGLYTSVLEILKLQGYYNAYAGIALPNPASVAFHERVGFTPVGVYHKVGFKHGQWHDVGWWEREIQPRASHPTVPKTLEAAQQLPEWKTALAKGEKYLKIL